MNFDLAFYWKLFIRRLPVMAVLVTLCTALGVFTALRMPETFSTSARLLVEEPQIPDSMVASTVRTDAVEQLDIIQQRLLTRANLIDIANRFEVYENMRALEPDLIVERMEEDTRIRRSAGRDQATLMTISFEGRTPQIVANVVNEYVTLVLEANMDFRMSRAESTLDFFAQEVERLGEELDEKSISIARFKSENADALPEDQPYRLGRQSLLQERLSLLERDLRTAVAQKEDLTQIFETTGRIGDAGGFQRRTPQEEQLIVARAELEFALTTYSETNPRVIRLQSVVDRLEAVVAAQKTANADVESKSISTPEEAMFRATMVEMDNRIASLETEIERTGQELDELQLSISASSANGIQLNALEREYEIVQSRYDNAVNNLNEARMSERIETTAQGQRITVIENANVPRLPSGPSPTRVIALGSGVGFALAAAFFFGLELLNRSIRRPAEMVQKFNITPITTIPYLESNRQKLFRRSGLIAATLVAVIGVPIVLWYIDRNYMPLDLVVQKVLSRFGVG